MSFQVTMAHSSRVTKSRKPSRNDLGLRRSTSSPSKAAPGRQSRSSASKSRKEEEEEERLDDTGVIASLATDLRFRDVAQYMEYIRNRMFSDIPEKSAGMNSTRIAEVLNYRASLPPIVTVAHVNALSKSSTRMEREIAELAKAGIVRRIAIPNRGVGAAAVGDGLVLVADWERLVQAHAHLGEEVKSKYTSLLKSNPTSLSISSSSFTSTEISSLTTAGFLTTASVGDSRSSLFAQPSLGSLSLLSSAGSKNASGTMAAVGGAQATQHISGGTGHRGPALTTYNFSLPNTGSHLRLLTDARTQLLFMLKRSRYREAPMESLHERWDGGVVTDDEQSRAKKARGEFAGVLPGRTTKWKKFWGLRFEWIIEECVGAGLVELFETRSVGVGVRTV